MRWAQHGTDRWLGFVDGRQVGYVGEVVTDGGACHYWLAWLQDDTAQGQVVGRFDTAEEAITATDAAV